MRVRCLTLPSGGRYVLTCALASCSLSQEPQHLAGYKLLCVHAMVFCYYFLFLLLSYCGLMRAEVLIDN